MYMPILSLSPSDSLNLIQKSKAIFCLPWRTIIAVWLESSREALISPGLIDHEWLQRQALTES